MIKYVEYIETDGTQIGWDLGTGFCTDINQKVYFDFMPLSGSCYGDSWYRYLGYNPITFCAAGNSMSSLYARLGNVSSDKLPNNFISHGTRCTIRFEKDCIYNETEGTSSPKSSTGFNTGNTYLNCESINASGPVRCIRARYYSLKTVDANGNVVTDIRPCLDAGDNPCFYDAINETYIYHQGPGNTPTAGPILSTIQTFPERASIPSSGGSVDIQIDSESDWTATTTGNWFTMEITSGMGGSDLMTVTVPSTTDTFQKEAIIHFENAASDECDFTLKQRKHSVGGIHLLNIGTEELDTIMIGDQPVETIYLGTEVVFQAGEFIGFKMKDTLKVQMSSGSSATLKIQSSEPWAISVDTAVTWLSFSQLTGDTGVTKVTVTATEENQTGANRSTTITATTANYSATCEVTQLAINYVSYIYANPLANDTTTVIDTGIIPTVNTKFRVQGIYKPLDTSGNGLNIVGALNPSYFLFMLKNWIGRGNSVLFDIGSNRLESYPQGYIYDDSSFDITCGNNFIDYNDAEYEGVTGTTQSSVSDKSIKIHSGWWFKSLQIWDGETLVFNGQAALDPNDVPCVYDSVSDTYKYSNAQDMAYEE